MPHFETMDRDKTLDPADPWTQARAAHFAGNEAESRALRAQAERRDAGPQSGSSSPRRGSATGFLERRPPTSEPIGDFADELAVDRQRLEELRRRDRRPA
jgi:hypothetical protein